MLIVRLTAHLALDIPEGDVGIRVANETRRWEEGKVLVFDDSFEHEVWNNSDKERAILLINFWNPHVPPDFRTSIVQSIADGTLDYPGAKLGISLESDDHERVEL